MDRNFALREALRIVRMLATDRDAGLDRIRRGMGILRAKALFRKCECGEMINALGYVRVVADGVIRLGDYVQFFGGMIPTEVVCAAGAELVIGAQTGFNYGCSIRVSDSIRIGERCVFGSMVRIRDETKGGTDRIVIGDDVWIAHGAIIEPGVTIGRGSVISAGSVVAKDVPEDSLAAGNPATSVKLSAMLGKRAG